MTKPDDQLTETDDLRNAEDVWFDELRHWPYTIHQIDDTLDSALIEGRAKQILFQSLNSYSVTAFIGTGISAAYGRMGWNAWRDTQLGIVNDTACAFLDAAKVALKFIDAVLEQDFDTGATDAPEEEGRVRLGLRWMHHRRRVIARVMWDVRNLKMTFDACRSDSGESPGGENLPILFEIAQKLHDLVIRHNSIFQTSDVPDDVKDFPLVARPDEGAPDKVGLDALRKWMDEHKVAQTLQGECADALSTFGKKMSKPSANLMFSTLAKTLLVDECPHAQHLLRQGMTYGEQSGREY